MVVLGVAFSKKCRSFYYVIKSKKPRSNKRIELLCSTTPKIYLRNLQVTFHELVVFFNLRMTIYQHEISLQIRIVSDKEGKLEQFFLTFAIYILKFSILNPALIWSGVQGDFNISLLNEKLPFWKYVAQSCFILVRGLP